MSTLARMEAVLESAVKKGITPGLCALVASGKRDGDRLVCSVGKQSYYEGAKDVSPSTIYDLASLTKILSTALLCARAVDEGRLALDETPWPNWPKTTIASVLSHRGGLLWWRAFYEEIDPVVFGTLEGQRDILSAVIKSETQHPVDTETVYSDLGFIALGALLEERFKTPLDVLFLRVAHETFGPTGLRYIRLAKAAHHPVLGEVAPTEQCAFRGRVLHGQVHDLNAFAMGGVAGHAGLFGDVSDLESAGRAFLNAEGALKAMIETRPERTLGFDIPTENGTTGGVLSDAAAGHLGFTGTSLWFDKNAPASGGAIFALLTNRVHPTLEGAEKMRDFRVEFHQAAVAWLRDR